MNEDLNGRLRDNLKKVLSQISSAAMRSGRDLSSIKVLEVSKKQPVELVLAYQQIAKELGIETMLGENYVQEAKSKFGYIEHTSKLHLIGPLQRNKAKDAVVYFDVIESLHTVEVAEAINRVAAAKQKVQEVYLQINISCDRAKSGFSLEQLEHVLPEIVSFESLNVTGLMTITAFGQAEDLLRRDFRSMKLVRDRTADRLGRKLVLSMGMSDDYQIAVEEGADLVRIGSAIFGERVGI